MDPDLGHWQALNDLAGRGGTYSRMRLRSRNPQFRPLTALLPVSERIRGPEHPDTLVAREQLAYWTGQAADPTLDPS